jgi:LemA protein
MKTGKESNDIDDMAVLEKSILDKCVILEDAYNRRADLARNLGVIVEKQASIEKNIFSTVEDALLRASQLNLDEKTITDEGSFANYLREQNELGSALMKLLLAMEKYPELKSNPNIRDISVQLEGCENRITVERQRYNELASEFNQRLSKSNPRSRYKEKQYFRAEDLRQDEEMERLEAEIKKKSAALRSLEVLMPRKRETDALLRRLQATAVDSNLKILRFTPRGSINKDFYSEWPIPISLSGSLKDLETYFDSLSKYNRLLDIQEINLVKRESGANEEVLYLDITLKTFFFNEEARPSDRTSGRSNSWKQDKIHSLELQNDIFDKKIELLSRLKGEQEAIPSKFHSWLSNR